MIAKVLHGGRLTQECRSAERVLMVILAYAYGYKTTVQYSAQHSGAFFHYAYDSVGNRLSETADWGTTEYEYDAANRLTSVDGVQYTWDANGNLLDDGQNTYGYDTANRLKSVMGNWVNAEYGYNGLGDRVAQVVDGVTADFVLDLNAGLTQVLQEGANTYLYGLDRISQVAGVDSAYFLGDALGSVRQLVGDAGQIELVRSYEPYGAELESYGSGKSSSYAFTGEWTDDTNLINLRSRLYSSEMGRFLTRDTWSGDYGAPLSINRWNYTEGNPIIFVDPSGALSCIKDDLQDCYNNLFTLKRIAGDVQQYVASGGLPVESFANIVDLAYLLYDEDLRGMMWGLSHMISGFDANNPVVPIWLQAYLRMSRSDPYFIGEDWLPYMNIPIKNDKDWGGSGLTWTHSRIGDWNQGLWDKTANQAYHFWFYAASSFFDMGGFVVGSIGDLYHDMPPYVDYDFVGSNEFEAPPIGQDGNQPSSKPDHELAIKGLSYGLILYEKYLLDTLVNPCKDKPDFNPGDWIRQNLKQ